MEHLETEFKWEANSPRAFYRFYRAAQQTATLSAPIHLTILDTYFDHADSRFSRQKIAFRVRQIGPHWECTFKTKTSLLNGRAVRREETLPLPVKSLKEACSFLTNKHTWKGLNVAHLHPVFFLTNHRTCYTATYHHTQSELAFDVCKIFVCGRTLHMKEIELELKKGSASEFEILAQQLTQLTALTPAKISKVQTAETLLKLFQAA